MLAEQGAAKPDHQCVLIWQTFQWPVEPDGIDRFRIDIGTFSAGFVRSPLVDLIELAGGDQGANLEHGGTDNRIAEVLIQPVHWLRNARTVERGRYRPERGRRTFFALRIFVYYGF